MQNHIKTLLAVVMAASVAAAAEPAGPNAGRVFDVRVMGAAGDGTSLDGPVVQRAIDAAAAAGGGTVVLAAGTYLSGAIRMRSQVTLRLEKDAVLLAAPDPALFPPVTSRWEGSQATYPAPLVVMEECVDASIVGAGTLSGSERCVLVKEGRNIRFDGITFISTLRWTLHLLYSDGIVVENCRFTTEGTNTDGIDPDSSRNIVIRKCSFSTGDDCIAIKSGVNAEGVRVGRPSENITIEDCIMERGHGAVSLGSEMSGGVRNVTIRRCRVSGCSAGVRIKTRRGRGGDVQNVHVSDCVISRTKAALLIDTQYKWTEGLDAIPGPAGIPLLRNFRFRDITGEGNKAALVMVGMPERPIEGIRLQNIALTGGPPGRIENARDVVVESLTLDGPVQIANVTGRGLPTEWHRFSAALMQGSCGMGGDATGQPCDSGRTCTASDRCRAEAAPDPGTAGSERVCAGATKSPRQGLGAGVLVLRPQAWEERSRGSRTPRQPRTWWWRRH